MTNEELDEARAIEANRIAYEKYPGHIASWVQCSEGAKAARKLTAKLARENWIPPPSPDLLKAREIVVSINKSVINDAIRTQWCESVLGGERDNGTEVLIALAALKAGREG